jgi:hypothetical protein
MRRCSLVELRGVTAPYSGSNAPDIASTWHDAHPSPFAATAGHCDRGDANVTDCMRVTLATASDRANGLLGYPEGVRLRPSRIATAPPAMTATSTRLPTTA